MSIRVAGGVVGAGGGGGGGVVIPDDTEIVLNSEAFQGTFGQWLSPGDKDPRSAFSISTSGGTPTGSTGADAGADPVTRAVQDGNGFAFSEASNPVSGNGPWSLESPVITAANGTLTLTFDLFMRFDNGLIQDGTLTVQGWTGSAWEQIGAAITGSKQSSGNANWLPSIDFSTYDSSGFTNADFRFRFLASRGQSARQFDYDISIDNVVVKGPSQSRPQRTDFDFDTGNRRLHVSQTNTDPLDGTTPDFRFTSIQAALNAVQPGDVVTVGDGRYFEAPSLTGFAGTAALPLWLVAETRGGVQISNLIQSVFAGTATWTDEGDDIYSLAHPSQPYAAWFGDVMLPQWRIGQLQGTTFPALANSVTGAAAAVINKPDRGFAYSGGRIFVKMPDASDPNGQSLSVTDNTSKTLLSLSASPNVIVDGIEFEGSGHTQAVNVFSNSSNTATVRNCIFTACRHGVRCGGNFTLIRYCEYRGVPGMTDFGEDLRDENSADSNAHERYHTDYLTGQDFGINSDRFAPVLDGSIDLPSTPPASSVEVSKCLFTDAFTATRIGEHPDAEFSENYCIGLVGPAVRTLAASNDPQTDLHVFLNQFENCQLPIAHRGASRHARHLVYRNLFLNDDPTLARPPHMIDIRDLGVGAAVHYYQNTFVQRLGADVSYGANGTSHSIWAAGANAQANRIATWQNNLVAFEADLDATLTTPAASGSKNNVVASPADDAASQLVQGTDGVYAGDDEDDLIIDADFVPDDGTRLSLGTSPAIDAGAALASGLVDVFTGANANDTVGALDSPVRVIDGDFPRPVGRFFDENPPERWSFPGNVVAPPPIEPPSNPPSGGSGDATATILANAANFTSKADDRSFNVFYEGSVQALGGSPESSGIEDLDVIYQGAFLPGVSGRQGNPDRTLPSVSRIMSAVNGAGDFFVPDIEAWFPAAGNGTDPLNQSAIDNFVFVGQEINKVKGGKRWGWYSLLPLRTLFGITRAGLNATWKASNDLSVPIADEVDFLNPSVYAFDSAFNPFNAANTADFLAYARGNIDEARRISQGKPVICFLWTTFHNFEDRYIPTSGVYNMLNVVLEAGAEGVDVWQTSGQRRDPFSSQNIWFQGWLAFRDDKLDAV